MKKMKLLLFVLVTSVTMSVNSSEMSAPQQSNILCELLGIGCVGQDGNGGGAEPPKTSKG